MPKRYPTIGCCGIDCGLCPRFYTDGDSRCPGCGGEGFERVHPPCSFKTCCADRRRLEVCALCEEYPCAKFEDREKVERDSFVTHKRIFQNHEFIRARGFDSFMEEQAKRVSVLREMLADFDDGRSKGYYCLAAALLSIGSLEAAVADTADDEAAYAETGKGKAVGGGAAMNEAPSRANRKIRAKALKAALQSYAGTEGVRLVLDK